MQRFQTSFATTVHNCFGLIALTLALTAVVPACATTWKVTSSADDGTPHTLRSALANANNGDTILISGDLKVPIVLTQGDLVVSHNVTIAGLLKPPTISGNNNSRLFEICGATVTLYNLNFTNGNGVSNNPSGDISWDGFGGAVLVDVGGALNVSNCSFTQNQCSQGGAAIELVGNSLTVRKSSFVGGDAFYGTAIDDENPSGTDTMNLTDCRFVNNMNSTFGSGGVVTPYLGTYTLTHCDFSNNFSIANGAIVNYGGTMTLTGCTLSGNSGGYTGGIFNAYTGGSFNTGATMTVSDCILYSNSAINYGGDNNVGGAIRNSDSATMTVSDCILCSNSSSYGGAIFNGGATMTVTGCTLSNNSAAIDGGGIFNGFGGGSLLVGASVFRGNVPDAIAGPSGYTDQGGNTFH